MPSEGSLRRKTRPVRVGDTGIGGDHPVTVQSMTKTDTRDTRATVEEIARLAGAGCQIVRVAVPDREAAQGLAEIVRRAPVPVVADIHFDYRLALLALQGGVSKLRLNPGNIGGPGRVRAVVQAARERGVPIRIGVNAGSLEKELLAEYGYPTAEAMVKSSLGHVRLLEDLDFRDIVISLKASDVRLTVEAYRLLAERVEYPLHLGITEAGTSFAGTVKSAVGIGALLLDGIGDTIRVSLTAPSEEEVRVGHEILKSLGLSSRGPVIVSCPTCGRCEIDLIPIARAVEARLARLSPPPGQRPLHLAVMGCAVNGPGEARGADLALAGGRGQGLLYRDGKLLRRVKEDEMVDALCEEAERLGAERWPGKGPR